MEISGFQLNGPKFVCDMTTIDGNVKSGPLTTTKHFTNALNHFKRGDRRNQFFTEVYTSVSVFGCWLMNQMIYLKVRQK